MFLRVWVWGGRESRTVGESVTPVTNAVDAADASFLLPVCAPPAHLKLPVEAVLCPAPLTGHCGNRGPMAALRSAGT